MAIVRCSCIAAPYPDETLYGWLCRIGLFSHNGSELSFLKCFMGYRGQQLPSVFPSFVGELADASGIEASILLNQHTLLPYFRPFTNNLIYQQVFDSLCNSRCCNAYAQLSLVANRVPERHKLFYCPDCVKEDLESLGVAIWHKQHQLPWVSVCSLHSTVLQGLICRRGMFVLPPQVAMVGKVELTNGFREAKLLARESEYLLSLNQQALASSKLRACYIRGLKQFEMLTSKGSIRQITWSTSLKRFWCHALPIKLTESIFGLKGCTSFPANLIYQNNAQHHPLKHLLVIIHLFETVERFIQCYLEHDLKDGEVVGSLSGIERVEQSKRVKLLNALESSCSLRQAAKIADVSVGFAKSIALQNGFNVERRAQWLFAAERKQILDWLKEGRKTQYIAKKLECSVGAVEQLLTQNPSIKRLRAKLRFQNKRHKHRKQILDFLHMYPSARRSDYQKLVGASYSWCFKNDKTWLYQHLPTEVPRQKRYKGGKK